MFEWIKRLFFDSEKPGQAPQSRPPSPAGGQRRSTVPPAAPRDFQPKTLAAELQNKHLQRPLFFEPALIQYRAFRAGEPVFENSDNARRWFAIRNQVLQHILNQISQSLVKEHLILRGSVLLSNWYGETARRPGDLDWIVTPDSWRMESSEARQLVNDLKWCLRGSSDEYNKSFFIPADDFVSEQIWIYEKAPGIRLIVPWRCDDSTMDGTIQMDIVFSEVMPSPPVKTSVQLTSTPPTQILSATPEQSLAWKLLWLHTDSYGQGKDLFDAVLLAESVTLDAELLRKTFRPLTPVFQDPRRIADFDPVANFNESAILHLPVDWAVFQQEYPQFTGTVDAWRERLAVALKPLFQEIEESRHDER